MYNFALKEIKEIKGRLKIFKLFIDGDCFYDQFEEEIESEGNLISELRTIETRLHAIADCTSLPSTKYKDITPNNDRNKEYEIKTPNLRVYLFHDKENGRVIVSGGKKTSQKSDIKRFRNIKRDYFNQKL